MDDLKTRIRQLAGQTLYTEAKRKPFNIEQVTDSGLWMVPLSSGIHTYSKWANVERAYQLALTHQTERPETPLTASKLRPASRHNSPYLLAVFRSIGAVK